MAHGTLELLLVSAKGLEDSDFLSGIDPYAVLTYRTQEKKSGVASGEGSSPEWNETFLFSISDDLTELKIKLMDKDTFTEDDFVGQAIIPLEPVFTEGSIPVMSYNVVKDETYCGEIKVALKFIPQRSRECFAGEDIGGSRECFAGEDIGGWKQSSMD